MNHLKIIAMDSVFDTPPPEPLEEVFPTGQFLSNLAREALFRAFVVAISSAVMQKVLSHSVRYEDTDSRRFFDVFGPVLHNLGLLDREMSHAIEEANCRKDDFAKCAKILISQRSGKFDDRCLALLDRSTGSKFLQEEIASRNWATLYFAARLPDGFDSTRQETAYRISYLLRMPVYTRSQPDHLNRYSLDWMARIDKYTQALRDMRLRLDQIRLAIKTLTTPLEAGVTGDILLAAKYIGPFVGISIVPASGLLSFLITMGFGITFSLLFSRGLFPGNNIRHATQLATVFGGVGASILGTLNYFHATSPLHAGSHTALNPWPVWLQDPNITFPPPLNSSTPFPPNPFMGDFNWEVFSNAESSNRLRDTICALGKGTRPPLLNCTEQPVFLNPPNIEHDPLPQIEPLQHLFPTDWNPNSSITPDSEDLFQASIQYSVGMTVIQLGISLAAYLGSGAFPIVWLGMMVFNGIVVVRDIRYLTQRLHSLIESIPPSHRFDDLGASDA